GSLAEVCLRAAFCNRAGLRGMIEEFRGWQPDRRQMLISNCMVMTKRGFIVTQRKRYALVGTGGRAGMYVRAIADTYKNDAELVAFCDLSQTRMNFYNARLKDQFGQQ